MVADEVVETPYTVCKTVVLTVELIGNSTTLIMCTRIGGYKDQFCCLCRKLVGMDGVEPS